VSEINTTYPLIIAKAFEASRAKERENIIQVVVASGLSRTAAIDQNLSVAVVPCPVIRLHQSLVGVLDLQEAPVGLLLLFGARLRMLVRMPLQRTFAIGLFYFLTAGGQWQAQHIVVAPHLLKTY